MASPRHHRWQQPLPALLALAAGLLPGAVHAQTAPAVPAAPTREELEGNGAPPQEQRRSSRLIVEGGLERGSCPLADPSLAAVKVSFSKVVFDHAGPLSPEDLRETWAEFTGREVSLATLCEVRDRAATMLRRKGYLAAVQVPPQKIAANGEVHMDVLVAKLADVRVRGTPGHAERLIAAHLRKLTAREWFNVNEAERHLLLLRDLPGFDVRLVLRPGNGKPGEVVGDVVVTRHSLEVVAGLQNQGSGASGRTGGFVQLVANDLTGLGDRTVVSIYNTVQVREQTVAQIGHDFAIGASGLRFGARFIYGRARPDIASHAFTSNTYIGELSLSYPVIRSQQLNLRASAGLDLVHQGIDFGGIALAQDNLSVAFARIDFDRIDGESLAGRRGYTLAEPRLRLAGDLEFRQGFAGLGASRGCVPISNCIGTATPISNLYADPQGTVLRGDLTAEFRPRRAITLLVSPRFQYSPSQLLGYEQFSLGNYTVGRGYDPGVVQADSGVGVGYELQLGRLAPKGVNKLAFQPYAFFDQGWGWSNALAATSNPRELRSVGAGVRARWGIHADAGLLLAVPLDSPAPNGPRGDVRLLFTLSARLLPWKFS